MSDAAPRAGEREDAAPCPDCGGGQEGWHLSFCPRHFSAAPSLASGERAPDDATQCPVCATTREATREWSREELVAELAHKDDQLANARSQVAALTAEGAQLRKALEEWQQVAAAWMLTAHVQGRGVASDLLRWAEHTQTGSLDRASSMTRAALASLPIPETKRDA